MPDLPSTLVDALKSRTVIPFVGAGVSRAVTDDAGRPLFRNERAKVLEALPNDETEESEDGQELVEPSA